MYFHFFLLLLPTFAAGQSLVLIGGNFQSDNAAVYNRIIELAVGWNYSIHLLETFPLFFNDFLRVV